MSTRHPETDQTRDSEGFGYFSDRSNPNNNGGHDQTSGGSTQGNHGGEEEPRNIEEDDELELFTSTEAEEAELAKIDPDFRQFRTQMLRFADEVTKLQTPGDQDDDLEEEDLIADAIGHRAHSQSRKRGRQPATTGPRKRIPRKAASPGGDIRRRLADANNAFVAKDYPQAKILLADIIRINAETYEAWIILALIFKEEKDLDNLFKALFFAAHLRPKHIENWVEAARIAIYRKGEDRPHYLESAQFCLQNALRIEPENLALRKEKAYVLYYRGQVSAAITEYHNILSRDPCDLVTLHNLATLCIDEERYSEPIKPFQVAIKRFQTDPNQNGQEFTWDDLDVLIQLYMSSNLYITAVEQTGEVGRWLLRRVDERFWSKFTSTDCEWDSDDTRRALIPDFIPGKYPPDSYGAGLPLQIRIKLAICRLNMSSIYFDEAMLHLKWLDPEGGAKQGTCDNCFALFREVGDLLFEKGHHKNALSYYDPLLHDTNCVDAQLMANVGTCYNEEGRDQDAEDCFLKAIELDKGNIDARKGLAGLYMKHRQPEKASPYVDQVAEFNKSLQYTVTIKNQFRPKPAPAGSEERASIPTDKSSSDTRAHKLRVGGRRQQLTQDQEKLEQAWTRLTDEQENMHRGDPAATQSWMEAAEILTTDFRKFKILYPWDRYLPFQGWSTENARIRAETSLESHFPFAGMGEYVKGPVVVNPSGPNPGDVNPETLPKDFRGIPFNKWLDIFLEYALCLAHHGKTKKSYEICEATKDAVVFFHDREALFLIHICYCLCALISNDEETCVGTARFFMKDFQFTTDSYRMFAAITRLCHSPISWYSSGPSQKYILRQIKAMDYALVGRKEQEKYFQEKGAYTAKDADGNIVINKDMDIALLMLYGHILFTGQSYSYALNYFFRACALDPENPMINLNIGLTYIHFGLKRQAENRQHIILQGITFFVRYYDSRKEAKHTEERQEAHYNMGRMYHMIGLIHLAIPYYQRVLDEVSLSARSHREDVVLDTAFNLQAIYSAAGNMELAEKITLDWLTI